MTKPPEKKRSSRRRGGYQKKPNFLPLIAGLLVVCALVAGFLGLRSGPVPQPALATDPTLPPNPYSAGDFAYDDNGYMTCTAGQTKLGIDVSDHQGDIDWQQVAQAGMEFAFVRIGYRGYSQGVVYSDDHAAYNLTQAKAAGLQVGAYFYSQAVNVEEAAQEAAYCVDFLKDHEIDLPLVFDWEYVSTDARTGAMDRETLTACAKAFCQAVEAEGYRAMIYANPDISRNLLDMRQLQDYPFWLALYSDTMNYANKIDYWQYTNTGSVPGIEGNVDINLMFLY